MNIHSRDVVSTTFMNKNSHKLEGAKIACKKTGSKDCKISVSSMTCPRSIKLDAIIKPSEVSLSLDGSKKIK